jgi:TonB family protein
MRAAFFTAALLTSLHLVAQSTPKPEPPKSEAQLHAESLLDRAHKLSDIRSKGAPAFRLKATFSFIGQDLNAKEGTYNEVWVSPSQWWRETVIDNLRRVEVGGPNRRWLLDNSPDFPDTATGLPDLVKLFPGSNLHFDFDSVIPDISGNNTAECAITKPGSDGGKFAFCFDKKSGALLQKVSPEIRPKNAVSLTCVYGIFRKFGHFWIPREMACFEEKHRKLEAKVTDIALEPSPDAQLFKPPPGAVERAECQGVAAPPHALSAPEPEFPHGAEDRTASVLLSLVVDINGKPQDLRVRRSGGKDFDDRALTAVGRWRFKAGSCDGEPIPTEINVEARFDPSR